MAVTRNISSLLAVLMAAGLAACGGGGSSDSSSSTAASSSASSAATSSARSSAAASATSAISSAAASAASSTAASSVAASSTAASSSSSSSAALVPAAGASSIHVDTRLQITFDTVPSLGGSGLIKVYKASDDTLVDTISLNVFSTGSTIAPQYTAATLTANNTQTAIPTANTEIDRLGYGAGTALTQWRWIFYRPVSISGKTATIRLHDGVLSPSTAYYVQIENGVLSGTYKGSAFGGISDKTTWSFTTRTAPTSSSNVTVDDDGTTADFRTVQGAINWVTSKCGSAGSDSSCTDISVAKSILVKNGTYDGELFVRNINNLVIQGESRAGVLVRSENFDQYNPGTGGSVNASAYGTLTYAATGGNRTRLNGGRSVLLVEGADLLKLTNFTLQNTHVKNAWEGNTITIGNNNQAETIYFNSGSLSGGRLIATYMNFYSTQDTIQTKGWAWFYQSLIKGDVDFVWGAAYAILLEESELRTVVDTTNTTLGGYVTESRMAYGFPGIVVLNSSLTREAGVPDGATYLSRQASNFSSGYCSTATTTGSLANANYGCNNVAYINTKMDSHIATVGWLASNEPPLAASSTTGYRESGITNLSGTALDLSGRLTTYASTGKVFASTTADLSGLTTRKNVFAQWNGNAGWAPEP
ncbi:Ig-like domain-containing protein [Uliginosibacterium sp. 31-12]|uniref:Ig-like domain-containing protein n=1 Tax=Uliginosibacterium sp. 31-12 TaxID=3062781 RepID=UPI0026E1DF76|nr:Ig-like domain-containing protein [Uliginosibacterium sp. 31-12]MDO6387365.1 Ig-like domain-containing protein [Uliginosibacterium sp. 31-12]